MNTSERSKKIESISGKIAPADQHEIDTDVEVCSVNDDHDGEKVDKDVNQDFKHDLNEVPEKKDLGDDLDTLSTINAEINAETKLLFNDFLAITTLHGIKYVYNRNHSVIRRFSWICVIITSYILLILTAKEHFMKFKARSTTEEYSTVRETSIDFPAVTICNANFVKSSLVGRSTENAIAQAIVDGSTTQAWDDFGVNETDDVFNMRVDDFLLAKAYQASDMILECEWKISRGAQACSWANFTQKVTSAGVCYVFNDGRFEDDDGHDDNKSGKRLTIKHSGSRESLWIRLNAMVDEYVSAFSPKGIGFKLLVHRRGDVPMVSDIGVAIMPGVRTLIAVNKQTETSLPHPYDTDCRDTPLHHYPFYSVSACLTEHETNKIVKPCKCKLSHMPGKYPVCTIGQYTSCALPAMLEENGTAPRCQRACYTEHFRTTMSYLKAPGDEDIQRLQKQFNWTRDKVTNNIAELEIYFASMNERQIRNVPAYSVADLWGDLGGIIGVHLGASLLTLFEFVDYTFVEQVYRMKYIRFFWKKIKSLFSRGQKQ